MDGTNRNRRHGRQHLSEGKSQVKVSQSGQDDHAGSVVPFDEKVHLKTEKQGRSAAK